MTRLLAAIALVSATLAAGCGYELRTETITPARAPIQRAAAPIPARARIEVAPLVTKLAGEHYSAGLGSEHEAQARARRNLAERHLQESLTEAGLFREVVAPDIAVPPREGDVVLALEATLLATPSASNRPYFVFLPPLAWIPALYTDQEPSYKAEWELTCRRSLGVVAGPYKVTSHVVLRGQGSWHMSRVQANNEAMTALAPNAVRALVATLAADTVALERMRGGEGAVTAAAGRDGAGGGAAGSGTRTGTWAGAGASAGSGSGAGAGAGAGAAVPLAGPAQPAPRPAATFAGGGTYVLLVGVNDYVDERIPDLRFAEPDARALSGFFSAERRSPTGADRVLLLAGRDATRLRVLRAIREHLGAKALRPEDTAILYFAGHGFASAADTYLASADAQIDALPETAISGATLAEYWGQVRAGRKVLLVDACRSGGLAGLRGIGGVSLAPDTPRGEPGAPPASSITIAATGPNELSTEDAQLGQGVFTMAILKGLRGEADHDADGTVTALELGDYLRGEVPALALRAGGRQTPVVSGSRGGPPIVLSGAAPGR